MHDDDDELTGPTALTEFMATPGFRNAVLGLAGAMAIALAVRAFQLSAPYMLCIGGGIVAVAWRLVLQPLLNKALWDVNVEDPDFTGPYFRLLNLRMAPTFALIAMVLGYLVSSMGWATRTQDGTDLTSSPGLVEVGAVIMAYAVAAAAVMRFKHA